MKKGIFFALLFGAFFMLILSLAIFHAGNMADRESARLGNSKMEKYSFIADDISSDLLGFLQIGGVALSRSSTHTLISIGDTLPLGYADPQKELSEYKNFVENAYANKSNLGGRLFLDLSAFDNAPFIYFGGADFNYSYGSLAKETAIFKGSNRIGEYSVVLQNADGEEFGDCGWSNFVPGSLGIRIHVAVGSCADQSVFISPDSESKFWVSTKSGKYLNMSFGLADGYAYSMKIVPNSMQVSFGLNITSLSTLPEYAYLPVGTEFTGEYRLGALIIAEN
ncbi:MAG: hypothetical protein V1835_05655 [Candidatus Micrarchaeota archaeon]